MLFTSDDGADENFGGDSLSLRAMLGGGAGTGEGGGGDAIADILKMRRGDTPNEWAIKYAHPLSAFQALGASLAFLAKRRHVPGDAPLLASPRAMPGGLAAFATPRQVRALTKFGAARFGLTPPHRASPLHRPS